MGLVRPLAAVVWVTLATALACAGPAAAAMVTVDSTGDTIAADEFCTLREAIRTTNTNTTIGGGGPGDCEAGDAASIDEIVFSAGLGVGVHTIAVGPQALEPITGPVEIDGSQGSAMESQVRIELDGSGVTEGGGETGLTLTGGSDGSYIHNIAVFDFPLDGIYVYSDKNTIEWVISGMDQGGAEAKGNGRDGISIHGSENLVQRSAASGNVGDGIEVGAGDEGADAGNTIRANRVGTNKLGTAAVPNLAAGVHLSFSTGASNGAGTTIGGPEDPTPGGLCDGDCNLISGNADDGIEVRVAGSGAPLTTGLLIEGNYVGTDTTGLTAIGNGTSGDAGVMLWGATEGAEVRDNLISGNLQYGVLVQAGSSGLASKDTTIAGNTIGLGADGETVIPNTGYGIKVDRSVLTGLEIGGTTIGGPEDPTPGGACDGDCNLISGNGSIGIVLYAIPGFVGKQITGTQILGNYIGTDVSGTLDRGHAVHGIQITAASETTVGTPAAPNVISANGFSGIAMTGGASNSTIQSNLIGTAADGVSPLPNGHHGIEIDGNGGALNTIGGIGSGLGNLIAHNEQAGVLLVGGAEPVLDTSILGNAIFANGLLGIDLRPELSVAGVTENGSCEEAVAPNRCQEFPVLTAAAGEGTSAAVAGTLTSDPSKTFRVEVFANSAADPEGNGEGERFLGAVNATTDGGGNASWLFASAAAGLGAGEWVSATATELSGGEPRSTSEFSGVLEGPICDVEGGSEADELSGGTGDEVICGFGEADTLSGGTGRDAVLAGAGDDTIDVADGVADALVDCGPGTDTVNADAEGTDAAAIFVGCETINRPALPVEGPPEEGSPAKVYKCKGKRATIVGTSKNDTIKGTLKADVIVGLGGNDTIKGFNGNDRICGGNGKDVIKGGPGNDLLRGEAGNDRLLGEKGNDRLDGGKGKDIVKGGSGNDRLKGNAGKGDVCDGQSGKKDKLDGKKAGCEKRKHIP